MPLGLGWHTPDLQRLYLLSSEGQRAVMVPGLSLNGRAVAWRLCGFYLKLSRECYLMFSREFYLLFS